MKSLKILCFSVFMANAVFSEAQVVWGQRAGYNMNFVNMEAMNTVVDCYNGSHPFRGE